MIQPPDHHYRFDRSTSADKWYVICLDEDGIYTYATHRAFLTEDMARAYARSVASTREAQVVYSTKPLRDSGPI